jgi:hypothetical protein
MISGLENRLVEGSDEVVAHITELVDTFDFLRCILLLGNLWSFIVSC